LAVRETAAEDLYYSFRHMSYLVTILALQETIA